MYMDKQVSINSMLRYHTTLPNRVKKVGLYIFCIVNIRGARGGTGKQLPPCPCPCLCPLAALPLEKILSWLDSAQRALHQAKM